MNAEKTPYAPQTILVSVIPSLQHLMEMIAVNFNIIISLI